MTYRTIIVGTDGSATAGDAVADAVDLAIADKARLVIVSAFEGGAGASDEPIPEEIRWQVGDRSQAEQIVQSARSAAKAQGATDVVVHSVAGTPAEVLLEVAEEFGADLIVVGSVGLTSPARFVLGSVAGSVAHHAPCDVLVVHTAA